MEISAPEWLNKNFLLSCLQGKPSSEDCPNVKVISYQVWPGVAAGNNYGSEILRVKVRYLIKETSVEAEKSVSLIIKVPIKNEITDIMSESFSLVEPKFYYLFLPKLREISQLQIAPKSYFTPISSIVVLEDLKENGFFMADRHKQLDFEHCKQYFTTSAKLHATGMVLAKRYPDLPGLFPSASERLGKDSPSEKAILQMVSNGLKCLITSLESVDVEDCYKNCLDSIKKITLGDGLIQKVLYKGLLLQKEHLKSFIHGDCWTTNMMFKYDKTGKPVQIRLLDFQVFNYDSIASDIINFTWMCATNEVLENKLHDLYNIYCDTLNSTLSEFGLTERLSYQQLREYLLVRSFFVLITVGVFLPITQAEALVDPSLFAANPTEEKFKIYYEGKYFWNKFPHILKVVEREGVFDWLEKNC